MCTRIIQMSIAAIVLLVAVPATAAPITFDFRGNPNSLGLALGNIGTSAIVSQGGLSATIRGFDPANSPAVLNRLQCCGLGVAGVPNGNSVGIGEAIEISFGGKVMGINTLILEGGASDGALDLFVNGAFDRTISWNAGGGSHEVHDLNGAVGDTFRFQGKLRGFRLEQVSVMPVPEPGAILLFCIGALVVGGSLRSKQR